MEFLPKPRLTPVCGQFTNPTLERAYREHVRAADQRLLAMVSLIIFTAFALVSLGDWIDARWTMNDIEWRRFIWRTLAVPVGALLTLRGIQLAGSRTGDLLLGAVLVTGLLIAVYLQTLWPPEFSGATYILIYVIFLLPLPLYLLSTVSFIFSAALVWLFVAYKAPVVPEEREFILWAIGCLNLLGFVANRHVGAQRRYAYYAGVQYQQAHQESERARRELRVLTGMIPICSSCKKIRDDGGDWHQMEKYIAAHSGAEFTHGFCESCAEEFLRNANVREL